MDHGAPSTTGDAASELAEGMSGLDVSDKTSDSGKSKTSDSGKSGASSEMSATLAKVEEMIAAGLILPMNFPDPGKPDGIRTFRKPILTLKDINFKYPETDKYILQKVEVTLTLGSRSVIVGGNGSGKSTALKLLVGDLEAEQGVGEVWKHHNLRLSYVAQQSLHHLEEFLLVTPVTYIQERFRTGLDKEIAKLKTQAISPEDEKDMEAAGAVYDIVGRAQKGKRNKTDFGEVRRHRTFSVSWVIKLSITNCGAPEGLKSRYSGRGIRAFSLWRRTQKRAFDEVSSIFGSQT
jgi:elongation factor 3